jgi:hypothetical protein
VKDILVGLSEHRDLGQLTLDIGSVTDEVTVTAEVTAVQTSTAERSSVIEGNQLNSEAIRGREMMSFMRMLPGVVGTSNGRDATGEASWEASPSTAAPVSRVSWWTASAI